MFSSTKHAVEGFPMIPNSHFILGHLPLMRDDDFRKVQHKFSIEHADAQGRCCFWMGTTPALSVNAAKDAQYVLKQSERSTFALMTKHMHECFGKRNIVLLNKREWKSNRSAIVKALHATAVQQSHARNMLEASDVLIQSLSQRLPIDSNSNNIDNIMEIGYLMKCLTMDIFGRSAMTADFGCCSKELKLSPIATAFEYLSSEMMRRINSVIDPTNYFYSLPLPKTRRVVKEKDFLRGYILGVVEERRKILENPELEVALECPQDLLTNLIKTQNHCKEQTGDEELSEETLVDVLMGLLIAGYDTTSVTLTYALYLISQNPSVEAKCMQELDQVWKATSADTRPEDLVYMNAVILETLRLYPPGISTTRSLEHPIVLDGVTIPTGTYLYVPIWWIQRDAKHFPDPEAFLPERWVLQEKTDKEGVGAWHERWGHDQSSSSSSGDDAAAFSFVETKVPQANRDAFLAFSAGARNCPGKNFALQEATLALGTLLTAFQFQPVDGYVLTPHRDGIVQMPKDGMPMHITKRSV